MQNDSVRASDVARCECLERGRGDHGRCSTLDQTLKAEVTLGFGGLHGGDGPALG